MVVVVLLVSLTVFFLMVCLDDEGGVEVKVKWGKGGGRRGG